jgi:hypothetical protein
MMPAPLRRRKRAPVIISNMDPKLWFKARRYGYGLSPATWEGWLVVGITLAAVGAALLIASVATSSEGTFVAIVVPATFVIVAVFIVVAFAHGEKPRWRWGK